MKLLGLLTLGLSKLVPYVWRKLKRKTPEQLADEASKARKAWRDAFDEKGKPK